jgi:uncharacterized membrane protein YqiK
MTTADQTPAAPAPAVRPAIVTIDDVRQQLAALELDPRKTNASVIQKALGRGGMSTVQKHLDAIRGELDKPAAVADGEIPPAPRDALDAVWRGAWIAAQMQTSSALATSLLERDQARAQLETARADVATLSESEEAAAAAAAAATQSAAAAEAARQAAEQALQALQAQAQAQAQEAAAQALQAAAEAAHALETAKAQHALEIAHSETRIATLQGQLDRMVEQLAEVKSLLPRVQQQ